MGSTSVAVDTLDRMAVQMQGIQEAAKQLRELGSYTDALAALKKQVEGVTNEVADAKAATAKAKEELKQLKLNAELTVREADERATDLLKGATEKAKQMLEAAVGKAAQAAEAHKQEQLGETITLDTQIVQQRKQLDILGQQIATALSAEAVAKKKAQDAQAELTAIHDRARRITS